VTVYSGSTTEVAFLVTCAAAAGHAAGITPAPKYSHNLEVP